MKKFCQLILAAAMLSFAGAVLADDTKQARPLSQGPDFSDLKRDWDYAYEDKNVSKTYLIKLLAKHDPRLAARIVSQMSRKATRLDRLSKLFKYFKKSIEKIDLTEKLYRDGFVKEDFLAKAIIEKYVTSRLLDKTIRAHQGALEPDFGFETKKRRWERYDKFNKKVNSWFKRFREHRRLKRLKMGLPEKPLDGINIDVSKYDVKKGSPSDKQVTNRPPIKNKAVVPKRNNYLVDDELNRTDVTSGEDEKPIKKKKTNKKIVEADEGGMLIGKPVKLGNLSECGVSFLRVESLKEFGKVSTRCPGLSGGRVVTPAEYSTYCKRWGDPDRFCVPLPGGKFRYLERYLKGDVPVYKSEQFFRGADGTPLSVFCLIVHYDLLASLDNELYNKTVQQEPLRSVFKYDNNNQKLQCFYLSPTQVKSLREQYKNAKKGTAPTKPTAATKSKKECKSSSSLTGAVNCVTKRIEGTDATDEKFPKIPPVFASSTDPETGITTKSVKNPDGSRTITRTNAEGIVLSRKKVR